MKRNDDFTLREVGGKPRLIPACEAALRLPGALTLSETAVFIWDQLATDRTVAQLVDAITGEYEVSADEAEKDIWILLNQMCKHNLLVS